MIVCDEQSKQHLDSLRQGYVNVAAPGLEALVALCHNDSFSRGWWDGDALEILHQPGNSLVPAKLMLTVSELSEAMEGHRKGKMDDHIPHRLNVEVELADALIRICDLAGALRLDLGGAVIDKLAYNRKRSDHDRESRTAQGGKSY